MKKSERNFSWMNPKLEVRDTKKYGMGVFAKEDIEKGEMLFVMGGYILTIEDENNLRGVVADKPIEISDQFSIGPRNAADLKKMPEHYLNHSCNPNTGFDGQIFMKSIRAIKRNEEVTFDYAMSMNSNIDSNSYFTINCKCGSKDCRKKITEDDWKIPELQKKYEGYFQWFLQKKIDKLI
jgi:hypothetical protein